ncbi:MAG: phosphatase PAP2 family protein [Abitibacteriaceae bacterium]|nr:phosphatase PAP2 family protein [Abditibacteriaceae bacterium]
MNKTESLTPFRKGSPSLLLTAIASAFSYGLMQSLNCLTPHSEDPIGEAIGQALSRPFNFLYVALSLALMVVLAILHRAQQVYWWPLDVIACELLVVDGFCKKVIKLQRPGTKSHPGFPSGHTSFAFALAYLVYQQWPPLAPLWFTLAALIGWARFKLRAHYGYQVIGGAIIGIAVGWLVSHCYDGVLFPHLIHWHDNLMH